MDVDSPQVREIEKNLIIKNGLQLFPVSVAKVGTGLPYAPQNWPNVGDLWQWKSGTRITNSGYFHDRYLYPPNRLIVEHGAAKRFKSKLSVQQFLNSQFPEEDVNAFFSSFSWQIASPKLYHKTGNPNVIEENTSSECKLDTSNCKEVYVSLGVVVGGNSNIGCCKARNERCKSFVGEEGTSSELAPCNICCTESSFCRLCCCILCCQSISVDSRRFEYIRCNAKNDDNHICGHIAHIECAIRATMVGTLEGNNGLDAEYYCLRCDSRTDLVSHVMKLIHSSETKNIRENAEEVLNVCVRMLYGSKRKAVLQLLHHIQAIIETKPKGGTKLKEVWGKEDASLVTMGVTCSNVKSAPISMIQEENPNTNIESVTQLGSEFDHWIESSKLEHEVDEVLSNLRNSQKDEYKVAEDRLLAQTYCIQKMYGVIKTADGEMDDQMKQEVVKLESMKEVEKGFGRTSEQNIKLHFDM